MTIKPGSYGLSIISGKTGKLVAWGQDIVDGRKDKFTHAFFVLDNDEVIEAEPGGAVIAPLSKYTSLPPDHVLFSDKPIQALMAAHDYVYPDEYERRVRANLTAFARTLVGIPYNYLDYVAIGLEHFKIDLPFIRNRVRREDRMICSQLVDYIYAKNGIHLFGDHRVSQNVTPGDLEYYARN